MELLTVKQQEWLKRHNEQKAAAAQKRLDEQATQYIKRVDVTSLAELKQMSVMEAAQLHLKANAGDAAARKVVWEARCERKVEKRVQEIAAKGGIPIDEARILHEHARDGDEASRDRIREIRQTTTAKQIHHTKLPDNVELKRQPRGLIQLQSAINTANAEPESQPDAQATANAEPQVEPEVQAQSKVSADVELAHAKVAVECEPEAQ